MPRTEVVFFQEDDGRVPVLEVIIEWARRDLRIAAKCYDRIESLSRLGHEMRRPESDILRDGIHELRATWGRVNYRILYFLSGSRAVLVCAIAKEGSIPNRDIELAIRFRKIYESDLKSHTYVDGE